MSNREQALRIVKRLRKEGFQALFAGGCVRDRLLGRPAKDYDVVTDAVPDQIIPLFSKTLKIGAQFGVIMVILDGRQVEVATFRTEGGYQDGRHPGHVEFVSAKEDALRRDFTVNGMFFDPITSEVLDFVDGRKDLDQKILRTIGDPSHRFSEDYLRLLRAVRFAVQLDFKIEEQTWQAVKSHASKICGISAERIAMEIEAVLTHPDRSRGARLLVESGLAKAIFPDFTGQQAEFGIEVLQNLPEKVDFALSAAAFWADVPEKTALQWAKSLKLSNLTIKHIRFLLEKRGVLLNEDMTLPELKLLLSEPFWEDLVHLQEAIQKVRAETLAPLKVIQKRAGDLAGKNLRPKPLLDGHELIALGAAAGPMVGRLAREMYIAQLAEEIHTPRQARQWASDWLKKHHQPGL